MTISDIVLEFATDLKTILGKTYQRLFCMAHMPEWIMTHPRMLTLWY